MRRHWLGILAALVLAVPAAARAEVTVLATVRPPSVAVGEPFELEVRVRSTGFGSAGDLVVPRSPDLKQLARRPPVELMRLDNFRASRERVETITYVASAPGRYVFQGLGIRSGDQFVPAPVVSIEVGSAGAPTRPTQSTSPGSAHAAPTPATPTPAPSTEFELPLHGEDFFAAAAVDRTRVRVGEPIVFSLRFYYRIVPERPTIVDSTLVGFQAFDLGQTPGNHSAIIAGIPYGYLEVRTLLYPERAGDLIIGPSGFDFRITYFGLYVKGFRRMAKQITIKVDPLPEGAPASFHGAVGDLSLTESALPGQASMQEPLTLVLTLAGNANFSLVSSPEPVSAGAWRIYPGRITDGTQATTLGLQGEKHFEILLQPPEAGAVTPPEFRFTYFNRSEGRYVTLHSKPAPIEVSGGGKAVKSSAGAPALALRPPRLELGEPLSSPLRPWRALGWLVPLPVLALVVLAAGRRANRRLRTVTDADRAHASRRKWERALDDKQADAAALLKAMDAWLHERYGTAASASEAEIRAALGDKAAALLYERKRLQAAVFGGGRANVAGMQQQLKAWLKTLPAFLLVTLAIAGAAAAAGPTVTGLFESAQQAQVEGRFPEAVRLYTRTGELAGPHVNLFYNLAGAAWRAGEPALARYAIETAYAYAPRDGDVAANRELIGRAIEGRGGSAQAVAPARMTLAEAGWLALALYALLTLLVAGGFFTKPLRWAAALVFALSIPVWGYASYLYQTESAEAPGVVWTAGVLREAGSEASVEIAPVPAGEVGRVTDRRNGWLRVQTAKGLSGWIPEANWRGFLLLDGRPVIPD
jgi:hypothetical protein